MTNESSFKGDQLRAEKSGIHLSIRPFLQRNHAAACMVSLAILSTSETGCYLHAAVMGTAVKF